MKKFIFIVASKNKYIKELNIVVYAHNIDEALTHLTPEERKLLKGIIEE